MNEAVKEQKIELDEQSKELVMHLVADVFESLSALQARYQSQYERRTFVRTMFSFLEGFGRVLRASMLNSERAKSLPLEWQFVLRDERIEVEQNGRPKLVEARFQFVNLFAATLRAWAVLRGWDDEQITNGIFGVDGWKRFRNSLSVRHALTHPKLGQTIEVDDKSLSAAYDSFIWFNNICSQLLDVPLGKIDYLMNRKPGT